MSQPSEKNPESVAVAQTDREAQDVRRWYLPEGKAFPKRGNTSIEPLICGAETFGALEEAISKAEKSICIITWGFDPSLRLRGSRTQIGKTLEPKSYATGGKPSCLPFPEGKIDVNRRPRIGDLLLYKASQGVTVRILVWNDPLARLLRIDENLPESGPEGKGPAAMLHRSLWNAKLADGFSFQRVDVKEDWPEYDYLYVDAPPRPMSEEELSRKLTAYSDKRLKNYCQMLARFREDYESPFKRLNSARASASTNPHWLLDPVEKVNAGFEDTALNTMKGVHEAFLSKYWRGYPCTVAGLGYVDSPGTQLDDHYYNCEWFLKVKGRVDDAPEWLDNIKIEYRKQERAVDGGPGPAFRRLNQAAARLEKLIPKLQRNKYFLEANEYMQGFLLWRDESDLMRAGEDAFASRLQNMFGRIRNFLQTNDLTNLYGLQDEISRKVGKMAKVPLHKLASMVKGVVELEELIKSVHNLAENGVRTLAATYHQKTVVIDYESESKAVGFVMGHNMLKNYLDDADHKMFGSPVRYPEFGPWQDISCRVRGGCLEDLVKNFHESWADAPGGPLKPGNKIDPETGEPIRGMAQVARTALNPGNSSSAACVPSMEVIHDWTAEQLEVVCNYMEDALNEAITAFNKTAVYYESRLSALRARLNENIGEKRRAAIEAELRALEMEYKAPEKTRTAIPPKSGSAPGTAPEAKPAVRGSDKESIYNTYLSAIKECSTFIYTENQYFRHEEIAEAVKARALEHTAGTNGTPQGGPIYWFVVTNHPVSAGEAPNTHKMLGILDQHERLGQITRDYAKEDYRRYEELADKLDKLEELEQMEAEGDFGKLKDTFNPTGTNEEIRQKRMDELEELRAKRAEMEAEVAQLEKKHYSIKKYGDSAKGPFDVKDPSDAFKLGEINGLRVLVATLGACDQREAGVPAMYTNIYVHSKLLVVDDAFMSLGSANINQRSMHVDAELNINTDSNGTAMNLRKKLFKMHTLDDKISIEDNFAHWQRLMDDNWRRMHAGEPLQGFLLHFCDPDTPAAIPTD